MSEVAEVKADPVVEARIRKYIEVREMLAKAKEDYENRIEPMIEVQNWLTGWMQEFMDKSGADSIKTKAGTCYSSTRYTASLADPQAFMNYVIEKSAWDLLDRKANATAVKQFVAENSALPPGVNLSALKTVGVRRR